MPLRSDITSVVWSFGHCMANPFLVLSDVPARGRVPAARQLSPCCQCDLAHRGPRGARRVTHNGTGPTLKEVPVSRSTRRRGRIAAGAAGLALLLGACSGPLSDEVGRSADEARDAVEDAREQLEGVADNDAVGAAVDRANEAIDAAREAARSDATRAEVERARDALDDARGRLSDAAEAADGPAREALDALNREISELTDELGSAG